MGIWAVEGVVPPGTKFLEAPPEDDSPVSPKELRLRPIRALSVVVKGKAHDVITNATTVGELLSAMKIEPDGNDRVTPPPSTPLAAAPRIAYAQVSTRTASRVQGIAPSRQTISTTRLPLGSAEMLSEGKWGRILRVFRVTVVNGKPVKRSLMWSRVLASPRSSRAMVGSADGAMIGEASWYYIDTGLTAASPWLPFGTRVTVTNLATGSSVTVVINDRGPFGGRIIDLSEEAFSHIAPLGQGVCTVRLDW